MKNLYKRLDVFSCFHESHRGFKNKISVYHILKEKACYPNGCFYFRWRCKQLSRQKKCYRGFSQVGRECFSCKDFYEEKIHNYPELQISEAEYRDFLRELDRFEDWIRETEYHEIEIAGVVDAVKPHFKKKIFPKANYLSFRGYIVIFKEIFLDRVHFKDYVYLRLSGNYFNNQPLGRLDKIEARARLKVEQGRLVLYRPKAIQIVSRGEKPLWDEQAMLLARESATEFSSQPEGCVQCPFGALVDVEYLKDHHSHSSRQLLCLKGVKDYKDCYVPAEYCGLDREANATPDAACESNRKIYHL